MGGELTVQSEFGQGATFAVALPRIASSASARGPSATGAINAGSNLVLHIEDNLANVKLVERILAKHGEFNVIPAMSGSLGLELARQHRPMLVLLDLHLPDIGGEEVLRRLRSDAATAAIPVVVLSADSSPEQARRLRAMGASAYLTKPVDVRELLRVLNDAFAAQPPLALSPH